MVKRKHSSAKTFSRWHAVPLKGSFMLTAILGVLISIYYVWPQSKNYGFAFILFQTYF